MEDTSGARFVPVANVGDPATARVLAARLEAEGFEVRLHSESFGPYPVTVGGLAETQIWVPDEQAGAARSILDEAADRQHRALSASEPKSSAAGTWNNWTWALLMGAVALGVLFVWWLAGG